MKSEWRPYLAAQLPRYTTYPTTRSFSEAVGAADYLKRLDAIGQYEPFSVYLALPHEPPKARPTESREDIYGHYARVQSYVGTLTKQISLVGERLAQRGRVTSLHFGGPSANYLDQGELTRILDTVETAFGLTDNVDLTMQVDPRLVSYQSAEGISALGISSVSLGVQDFDPEVQSIIGRVQSYTHICEVVNAFQNFGIFDICLDVSYGLPGQSLESFRKTIELALSLSPERLSLHGYAHDPGMNQSFEAIGEDRIPDLELRCEQLMLAQQMLRDAHYVQIGYDHFAKTDAAIARASYMRLLKRNFQGFTADPATTVLGFGKSALSQFEDLIVQNEDDHRLYKNRVENGDGFPIQRGVCLTREDQVRAKIIEDLLCYLSVDVLKRCTEYDVDLACLTLSLARVKELRQSGLVDYHDGKIRVAEDGQLISRVVASCFDTHISAIIRSSYAI